MLPTSTATPLALTADDLATLDKARGWARFLAIVGFILCGLFGLMMALGVVAALVARGSPAAAAQAGAAPMGIVAGVSLVVVGFGVAYFALVLRYASGVAGHARGDTAALARAFWGLKVLWIIMVVSYCLSIVFTIVMTIAQLLGYAPGRTT